VNLIFEEPI